MIDEKTLREEFEAHFKDDLELRFFEDEDAYEFFETQYAWFAWKAAHAKYSQRWLPIDEAAKYGRPVDLWVIDGSISYRVCNAFFDGEIWVDENDCLSFGTPTHYMTTPDAPSNDA